MQGVGEGKDFFTISVWESQHASDEFAPVFRRVMKENRFTFGTPAILPVSHDRSKAEGVSARSRCRTALRSHRSRRKESRISAITRHSTSLCRAICCITGDSLYGLAGQTRPSWREAPVDMRTPVG